MEKTTFKNNTQPYLSAENLNKLQTNVEKSINQAKIDAEAAATTELQTFDNNLINRTYPVGSIYLSVLPTNPTEFFGGTWEAFGQGRVLVGVDNSDTDFSIVEKTGGEKTHVLTLAEMANHGHSQAVINPSNSGADAGSYGYTFTDSNNGVALLLSYTTKDKGWISSTLSTTKGNNQAHNNLQPYITCYMWKRTA